MNKYALFGFMSGILLYIVFLVGAIEGVESSEITVPDNNINVGISGVRFYLSVFWDMLAFDLENAPPVVSMLFWPFTLVYGYMAIDIIKDVIPLT